MTNRAYDRRRYYGHDHKFPPTKVYGEDFETLKEFLDYCKEKGYQVCFCNGFFPKTGAQAK